MTEGGRIATSPESRLTDRHAIAVAGVPSLVGSWDQARLERVLDNLLDNAVKYSPDGGEVTITVARGDGVARLSVTDRGVGIPADDAPRIFER